MNVYLEHECRQLVRAWETMALHDVAELITVISKRIAVRDETTDNCSGAIEEARNTYCHDDIEIDERPLVATSKHGNWVQAWVYVPDKESE